MSYASFLNDLTASSRPDAPKAGLAGLSSEQFTAYKSPLSQSAVLCAGAGAGKTRLLVERVAALLKAGANPKRVGVVAFTRKSAQEITTRVQQKLGGRGPGPVCATVHALAYGLVVKAGDVCLPTPEQEIALLSGLRALLPSTMEDLSDKELLLLVNRAREESDTRSTAGLLGMAYAELLRAENLTDFTDLLLRACEKERDLFDYLLVDEAQDLSQLQLEFLTKIAPRAVRWYIGDPDQAIYGFRGAHKGMMHQLQETVDATYYLSTNYRCGKAIVTAANYLVQHNVRPFAVSWTAAREEEGSVHAYAFESALAELDQTVAWLKEKPQTRCALARTQALVAPYKELGLQGFTVHESKGLEWPEVRVLGCEEGLFPHPLGGLEEERRLFYVAMTRAKDRLEMSYCKSRAGTKQKLKTPSRFFAESQVPMVG